MAKKMLSEDEIEDYLSKGFILCRSVIEMVGAPKEYIEETIKKYVDKIKENRNIKLVSAEFSEAEEIRKLFSVFVELEFLAKNPETIVYYCFDTMPVSIEILHPTNFNYKATEFAAFFNDFLSRLHKIDLMVKDLTAKNKNLLKNSNLLLRNMIIVTLEYSGPLAIEDLSVKIGISGEHLKTFIQELVNEGWLREENGRYINTKKSPALKSPALPEKTEKKKKNKKG